MSRKLTTFSIGLVVVVGLSLLVASRLRNAGEEKEAMTQVSLRLAWLPGPTFAGDYSALRNGFWEMEGLSVSVQPGGFEQDALKLVAAGSDTFGITSGPQLLQARANGVPVVAIGAVIPRSPIGWVSKQGSGIRSPQDFVGHRIGAQFGTHTEVTLEALCGKLGIPLDSFERIPVRFDPRPFVVGDVDVLPVYLIDQPIDLQREGLNLNPIDPWDFGVGLYYGNLYFTTEEILRQQPEIVRAFLRGAGSGWIQAEENREETVAMLLRESTGNDPESVRKKLDATFEFILNGKSEYTGVSRMKMAEWKSTSETLSKYGSLSGELSLEEAFTNDYLQH